MIQKPRQSIAGLFYGWRMVAVGCAIRMLGGGFHLYGFTNLFLTHHARVGIESGGHFSSLLIGPRRRSHRGSPSRLPDRSFGPAPYDARRRAVVGCRIHASGDSKQLLRITRGADLGVISLSFSAGFMHSPMVLANTWFIRRRALAMTLISSAIGIGGTIITPALAFSVQTWGWRQGAFSWLG